MWQNKTAFASFGRPRKKIWTKRALARHTKPMLSVILSMMSLLSSAPVWSTSIVGIQPIENGAVIRFDDIVSGARVFGLTNPQRIAVDVMGVQSGAGPAFLSAGSVRQGQYNADTARLVIDLQRNVTVSQASFAPDGRSLAIWFQPVSSGNFLRSLSDLRLDILPPLNFRKDPPKNRYSVDVNLPAPRSNKNLPKIYGANNPSLPLIVLDAGHGGHDPGAISPHGENKQEKNVTLGIARRTRDALVATGRFRVALTREDDRFVVLNNRYQIARDLGADLFISIHADSAGNESARGASVYTLSEVASDREARKLAARENKSDIINGVNLGSATADVSSILIDLTQRETMNVSSDFAKALVFEGSKALKMRSDGHKFASFVVLKAPDTPSILFETGYLSNAEDAAFLASSAGQSQVAQTITNASHKHFERRLAMR